MIAICLGGAPSVWSDLKRAKALIGGREHLIIACNHMGFLYPGHLDAWATLHPELLEDWRAKRGSAGFNTDYEAFIHARKPGARGEVVKQGWYGSSGLYMAQVALGALACSGAILCGVPQDVDAGHITGAETWPYVDRYRPGFLQAKSDGANIRSMSGWSAGVFGEPNADWISSLNLGPLKPRSRRKPEATMRIRMKATHNFTPADERRITVKYREGQEYTVKRDWGAAMVKGGVAVSVKAPPRDPLDHDGDGAKRGSAPKTD